MSAVTQREPGIPPLRAGVVGLGMMGRNHVRVYDEVLPDVELIAVADPDAVALRRATTGRAARGYADPRTMFDEEHLDLVSIVAPTSLHRQATLEALASGANVLVEKPIASDRADAEAMISVAEQAGLPNGAVLGMMNVCWGVGFTIGPAAGAAIAERSSDGVSYALCALVCLAAMPLLRALALPARECQEGA